MTLAAADIAPDTQIVRGSLPLWVGIVVFGVLVVAGNHLLNDPDTQWQITIGQWILDHRAVPHTDVYSFTMRGAPWISTQWLAQVLYASVYAWFGWSGPVVLAALAIAATFALLARYLVRSLSDSAALIFVAVAFALTAPHLLARPHVLALPIMVVWIGELIAAADRRAAPSFLLLPLMALWANLHGGFVFGLVMVAPIALDCLISAAKGERMRLAARWAIFASLALAASCCTPYGWDSLLASRKILALGSALPLITEWRAADFATLHPFEVCLLGGIGLALYRGITLPLMRIVILLGLVHMALAQARAAEILALLAPLVLAAPLARQIGEARTASASSLKPVGAVMAAALVVVLAAGTLGFAATHRFAPNTANSPVKAVAELKKLKLERVFNDYDFGGYLIASGVAPFIDGRTELYGETFFVDQHLASELADPDVLFRLLDAYQIQATLLRTQSPAAKLFDHLNGWRKIYSDDIATIHVRKAGALHAREPAVNNANEPRAK
ncbi:hypothetical protein [Bradyrhizobium sp.]|uniref:hypothetical protein n=1 Tax=Bradyrhizobium sp. TaxID=376 RepID=UPI002D712CF1|nr:hypothetical protein [Bradyrhizobium sp.]HZR73136.1 hypothetical protein [Bradyrhizobium sp.]